MNLKGLKLGFSLVLVMLVSASESAMARLTPSESVGYLSENILTEQEPSLFYDAVSDQWYVARMDDGRYPVTRIRKLVYGDVANLSASDLRIMRNEIYARHGYIFSSDDLKQVFVKQTDDLTHIQRIVFCVGLRWIADLPCYNLRIFIVVSIASGLPSS